jgi:hypothetical protein
MKVKNPLNHDSRISGCEMNTRLPEYKVGIISNKSVYSVDQILIPFAHIFAQHVSKRFNNIISNKDST